MDFTKRRQELSTKLSENSWLVLFAGEEVIRNADELYPFSVNHSFYYYSGIEQKNSILVLAKIHGVYEEKLFILPNDPLQAKWIGEFLSPDQAREISGINNVKLISEFITQLEEALLYGGLRNIYLDLEHRRSDLYEKRNFRDVVRKNYPTLEIRNCFLDIASQRCVKDAQEIECIKKAIEITGKALEAVRLTLKAGYYEYQIAALFEYNAKANGVKELAFNTIAAAGVNATVLHYWANNCVLAEGAMLLLDLGVKFNHYAADISRTYPVSGAFDERQRAIYQLVLNGQKMVMAKIQPGITTGELNDLLKAYYVKELSNIGLITQPEQVENYYWHGVSHGLGLDTHDIGILKKQALVAGNVITVEPGLYISEWGIGVRIEDNVLVTPSGYENLSSAIAKEINEIEGVFNVR